MIPQIPGVTLAEEIGVGGFGTVYRGVQTIIGRDVAVKVDSRTLTDERDRRRFEREITAAGRVSAHPNIVSLYDAGINADGRPYLVMELYTGGSYAGKMKSPKPIPTAEVLDVGIAIADALAAAHDEGILHRDVKPGNILISRYGTPALADFGLAALPRPGADASVTLEALTPAYSAPESFALTPPSAATDIFGLGSTLYALLKGGAPRSDPSGQSPSLPHLLFLLNQPLPSLGSRPDAGSLMQVIWRATATLPEDRYATAAEMRDDLMLIKAGYPVIRPQTPPIHPAPSGPSQQSTPDERTTITGGRPHSDGHPADPLPSSRRNSRISAIIIAVVVVAILVVAAVIFIPRIAQDNPSGTALAVQPSASTASADLSSPPTDPDSTTDSTPPAEAEPSPQEPPQSPGSSAPEASAPESSAPDSSAPESSSEGVPVVGQCFGGLVTIGDSRTASVLSSCTEPHYWESFASGVLDPSTASPLMNDVLKDTQVVAACTQSALSAYMGNAAAGGTYSIEVIPPREALFYQGDKGFHCVAALDGAGQVTTSFKGN